MSIHLEVTMDEVHYLQYETDFGWISYAAKIIEKNLRQPEIIPILCVRQ